MAVVGLTSTGEVHVLWGKRLRTPHMHIEEAIECRSIFHAFRCHFLAHDYTGAGTVRETILRHSGIPTGRLIPIALRGPCRGKIFGNVPATTLNPRAHYYADKAASLSFVCACFKMGIIRTFQYDMVNSSNPGLLTDFTALREVKVPTTRAGDVYTVQRHANLPDDFAQAVNLGCLALWHAANAWPKDVYSLVSLRQSAEEVIAANPQNPWNEEGENGEEGDLAEVMSGEELWAE